MHINWKKTIIIALDLVLGTYLIFAFTRFNKPDETKLVCTKVNINIQDEMTNGFLNAKEIKKRLEARKLYPLGEPLRGERPHDRRNLEDQSFRQDGRMFKDSGWSC